MMRDKEEIQLQFQKNCTTLRYWLLGRNYITALKAMDFAGKFHTGTRKDNLTPEFAHQVQIAMYLKTLEKTLMYPEETLATAFLHDIPEDYAVGYEELVSNFGHQITTSVRIVTKKHRGLVKTMNQCMLEAQEDPIASVVKGADRMHNLQTMEVFTSEKKAMYIDETKSLIIPALKYARRKFPEQEPAYENLKLVLNLVISTILLH